MRKNNLRVIMKVFYQLCIFIVHGNNSLFYFDHDVYIIYIAAIKDLSMQNIKVAHKSVIIYFKKNRT